MREGEKTGHTWCMIAVRLTPQKTSEHACWGFQSMSRIIVEFWV